MKNIARAVARVLGTLRNACMQCSLGNHCYTCICCSSRP